MREGVWRPMDVFFCSDHVCLVSAQSDRPDHADSLSTTYLSHVNHSSHATFSGGTYIWTLVAYHLSMQRYVAATP